MNRPVNPLREKMLEDAQLILRSVAFFEREINKKMSQIEEAENNKLFDDLPLLGIQLLALLKKIKKENDIMDTFLIRYKRLIKNEKQKILSDTK